MTLQDLPRRPPLRNPDECKGPMHIEIRTAHQNWSFGLSNKVCMPTSIVSGRSLCSFVGGVKVVEGSSIWNVR